MLEGVPSGKIDVVPMGVDLTVFRPDERYVETDRERLRIGRNDIVILCIGRMVWEKGIYDYLHAAATVMRDPALKDCPVKFLVVGKGQELQGVHERAARLSLGDTFVLREEYPYQQICRLHNLCDIFVLPSIATKTWQEQFGMVLIESMACGKPVISTLSGSIPEVVGDAGILVQPNDHLSLYKAAKQLMLDRELRAELGRRGLERARERYDSRKTAERIGQIFEKVLCRCSDKEDPDGMYEEGMATWNRGHRLRGFDTVRKAFFMDPDRADVIDSLVRMGMELKRYETVEKALREYLSYHPVNFDALISLSEVLVCLGRTRDAEEELRKVFIFNKENRRACELRDRLSSISPAQKTPV